MTMRAGGPAVLLALLAGVTGPAAAQDWLILGGVIDGEGWVTDSGSRLLTRNEGRFGSVGRVTVWGGVAPTTQLQAVVLVEGEAGPARRVDTSEVSVQGLWVRYAPSRALVVDAGKLLSPMGAFGPRRLSPVNPLIDRPDTYPPAYPWGAQVSGGLGRLDYRIAVVNRPAGDPRYLPAPGTAPRLVAGIGIRPFIGAHLGASFTRGPYLGEHLVPLLPPGADWKAYRQSLLGLDVRMSRGYAEFHGELVFSRYDAPLSGVSLDGVAYYGEIKYTWTPRLYTAARFQRNKYPFISPRSPTNWIETVTRFYSGEIGLGLRLSRNALVKLSYQQDNWETFPDGRALAMQFSYTWDVADLIY